MSRNPSRRSQVDAQNSSSLDLFVHTRHLAYTCKNIICKARNNTKQTYGSSLSNPSKLAATFFALSMLVSIIVYGKVLVRITRRFTGNHEGITILQKMGIGIFLNMVCMAVASSIDLKRINIVKALVL